MQRKRHESTRRRTFLRRPRHWLAHLHAGLTDRLGTGWNLPLKRSSVHLLTLVLALLTLSLLVNFITQVIQSANLEARRAELATEVAQVEQENLRLRDAVEYAESDVHVERVAREQLGYARDGETVLLPHVLVPTPTPTPTASPTSHLLAERADRPNWQRWWDALVPDNPRLLQPWHDDALAP